MDRFTKVQMLNNIREGKIPLSALQVPEQPVVPRLSYAELIILRMINRKHNIKATSFKEYAQYDLTSDETAFIDRIVTEARSRTEQYGEGKTSVREQIENLSLPELLEAYLNNKII